MADNRLIKDALGQTFTIRMRDISTGGDGSVQRSMIFTTPYPLDYGTGGSYRDAVKSGSMAAGLAAGATIYSFQWPSSSLMALIKRIKFNAWTLGTGFAAGIAEFTMTIARSFTAADGGGNQSNLIGGSGRLRSIMSNADALIMCATTAALTPGTRTLDADAIARRVASAPVGTYAPMFADAINLFEAQTAEHPLLFVQNEGFVIQAAVPATGIWQFAMMAEWDEVVLY
jgi:hypothetical protein